MATRLKLNRPPPVYVSREMIQAALNIIEGGCYHLCGDRGPKIDRKYVVLDILIEIIAIIATAYRVLSR